MTAGATAGEAAAAFVNDHVRPRELVEVTANSEALAERFVLLAACDMAVRRRQAVLLVTPDVDRDSLSVRLLEATLGLRHGALGHVATYGRERERLRSAHLALARAPITVVDEPDLPVRDIWRIGREVRNRTRGRSLGLIGVLHSRKLSASETALITRAARSLDTTVLIARGGRSTTPLPVSHRRSAVHSAEAEPAHIRVWTSRSQRALRGAHVLLDLVDVGVDIDPTERRWQYDTDGAVFGWRVLDLDTHDGGSVFARRSNGPAGPALFRQLSAISIKADLLAPAARVASTRCERSTTRSTSGGARRPRFSRSSEPGARLRSTDAVSVPSSCSRSP